MFVQEVNWLGLTDESEIWLLDNKLYAAHKKLKVYLTDLGKFYVTKIIFFIILYGEMYLFKGNRVILYEDNAELQVNLHTGPVHIAKKATRIFHASTQVIGNN
jgi:hypothetical protein